MKHLLLPLLFTFTFPNRSIRHQQLLSTLRMQKNQNQNPEEHEASPVSDSVSVPLLSIAHAAQTEADTASAFTLEDTETSSKVVHALQTSGFLLVKSPLLSPQLQAAALRAAASFLTEHPHAHAHPSSAAVITHPTDPKTYAMLSSADIHAFPTIESESDNHNRSMVILKQYLHALQTIKMDVLRHIAIGLHMKDPNFFSNLHSDNQDTLRLISYHPTHSPHTGNRCKEHSDYGTITLLSTDGVSGLELFTEGGTWMPVPYVPGALVVNVGSLLSGWTKGALRATLHRVAGPASLDSGSDPQDLLQAVNCARTSIAFFADPNPNVSVHLNQSQSRGENHRGDANESMSEMTISEYIEWRSGGTGVDRTGVSFTTNESMDMKEQQQQRK
jgi:hypothetical protein